MIEVVVVDQERAVEVLGVIQDAFGMTDHRDPPATALETDPRSPKHLPTTADSSPSMGCTPSAPCSSLTWKTGWAYDALVWWLRPRARGGHQALDDGRAVGQARGHVGLQLQARVEFAQDSKVQRQGLCRPALSVRRSRCANSSRSLELPTAELTKRWGLELAAGSSPATW
ncbi:MAG: hypothetical protein R2693_03180 [Nocardioidaceae bacterium]